MRIENIFIFLYAAIGIVPYFESIDKQYPQNLYLILLNISVIAYYSFRDKTFINEIKKIISKVPILLLIGFFIWSSFTSIFAINYLESLSTLPRLFNQLVCLIMLTFLFSRVKDFKLLLFWLVSVFLSLEVISVISVYIFDIIYLGKPGYRAIAYRGFSGNINIMAYVMLPQITLVFYYLFNSKNLWLKRYLWILNTLAIFCIISIFKTRSAIVVLFISMLLTCIALYRFLVIRKIYKNNVSLFFKFFKVIIIPFLIVIVTDNYISQRYDGINVQSRVSTLGNISTDSSLQQRIRYIKATLSSFTQYPIFGVGIGNWEIVSLKYENPDMTNFVVPYHAHNDYLEILAETGVPGFLIYFGLIFLVGYLLLKKILTNNNIAESTFLIFLFIWLLIHLFDSLFNFPFDRIFQQVYFAILLAGIFSNTKMPVIKLSNNNSSLIISALLLLLPLSLYSSARLFNSGLAQKIFITEFNRKKFDRPSLEEIEKLEIDFKNVSQTAMPMYSIKGIYYFKQNRFEEAIEMFRKGSNSNPYMHLGTSYIGQSYSMMNQLDSALYYTKKAFEKVPNNFLFYGHYVLTLEKLKDSIGVKKAFNIVNDKYKDPLHEEIYLGIMNNILSENKTFALENIDLQLKSGNDQLKKNYYAVKIGAQEMYRADLLNQQAESSFEDEDFEQAAELFLRASNINPLELPYKENTANAYMKIGKDSLALKLLNELINEEGYRSSKAFYLRGLVLYGLKDEQSACRDLKIADEAGLFAQTNLYSILCN
ncbi:MAG: hypothetical protein HOK38_03565 [Flavobacteriaceae bacterium]|nr:hypothetical protein [Flavobacteriaceae bacterium]